MRFPLTLIFVCLMLVGCEREQHARTTVNTFISACDSNTIRVEQHTADGRTTVSISCQAY